MPRSNHAVLTCCTKANGQKISRHFGTIYTLTFTVASPIPLEPPVTTQYRLSKVQDRLILSFSDGDIVSSRPFSHSCRNTFKCFSSQYFRRCCETRKMDVRRSRYSSLDEVTTCHATNTIVVPCCENAESEKRIPPTALKVLGLADRLSDLMRCFLH